MYLNLSINTGLPKLVSRQRQSVWQRRLHSTQCLAVMAMAKRKQSFHNYGISKQECNESRKYCGGRELGMSESQVTSRLR
jgi:hypothetical protein